jgi:hypothetical protein
MASRITPVESILDSIPLEKVWSSWGLWDKHCCVFTAIAACGPHINTHADGTEVYTDTRLRKLASLVERIGAQIRADFDRLGVASRGTTPGSYYQPEEMEKDESEKEESGNGKLAEVGPSRKSQRIADS